jgi:hypothetical protein
LHLPPGGWGLVNQSNSFIVFITRKQRHAGVWRFSLESSFPGETPRPLGSLHSNLLRVRLSHEDTLRRKKTLRSFQVFGPATRELGSGGFRWSLLFRGKPPDPRAGWLCSDRSSPCLKALRSSDLPAVEDPSTKGCLPPCSYEADSSHDKIRMKQKPLRIITCDDTSIKPRLLLHTLQTHIQAYVSI